MNDHHSTIWTKLVHALNWVAAALGIGSAVELVNVAAGVASFVWLTIQVISYFAYDLPVKRARLAAARAGDMDACETDRGELK